ncbi:MAG: 4-(cytidine 5'-diphospho)-2-C-methyl-D-erythritol kinase, partial [Saezia sp.]
TPIAVLKPDQGVATQQIFSSKLLTKNTRSVKISDFISSTKNASAVLSFGKNDLQQAAIAVEPQIQQAIHWLENHGVKNVRMTGSGSAVFGMIDTLILSNNSPPVSWKLKLCRILDSHPHVQWTPIHE